MSSKKSLLKASLVPSTELVASPRASPPRMVLRSRQGKAAVNVDNVGVGGSSSLLAVGPTDADWVVTKCKDSRCKTCPYLSLSKKVISNVSHKIFEVVNHTGENLDCHSQNIVYLLTCNKCNIQYVGETVQQAHNRINGHRTGQVFCVHLIGHRSTKCEGHDFSYQILEKFQGTGYDEDGRVCSDMTKIRVAAEIAWMKALRTIYPYGLNEKGKGSVIEDGGSGSGENDTVKAGVHFENIV